MPRVNWVFLFLALVGVGGGAALWIAQATAHGGRLPPTCRPRDQQRAAARARR